MTIATELLVILCLIVVNGVFAGAEIAALSLRKTRLRELADEGGQAARALMAMRESPEAFLATVQIGITVVGATAAAFGGANVARELATLLRRAGAGSYAGDVALAIVVAGVSFLSIVLGELVPKSLALRASERYALLIARPLRGLSWLMRPLVWFLTASSNLILRAFHDKTTFTETQLSKEELQQLVDEAATAGAVDPRAAEIAYRALDFGNIRVAALMVPRAEMITVARDVTRAEVLRLLTGRSHTRIPVCSARETPDDIVGYVTAHDLIGLVVAKDGGSLAELVRKVLFVPESRRAVDLLADMQQTRDQLALIIDAAGGITGLVTLEDLVEELVGEIFGEHETPVERIHREADGAALVRGRVPVHELNRELGIDLPEGPNWTTIAGFATSLAGSLPRPGRTLDAGRGVAIEIVDATERRVQLVRIRLPRDTRRGKLP